MLFKQFKNLIVYQLTKPNVFKSFNEKMFTEALCPELAPGASHALGFTPLVEDLDYLDTEYCLLLKIRQIELKVPNDFVKAELKKRKAKHQEQFLRPANREETNAIKDAILDAALLRAFPRERYGLVMLNKKTQQLYINVSSTTTAETVLAFLRRNLGSLPVVPMLPLQSISTVLTEWCKETNDVNIHPFSLGHKAQLASLDNIFKSTIANESVDNDEVKSGIKEHKRVTKLELDYEAALTFYVNDAYIFTQLKWSEDLADKYDDIEDLVSRYQNDAFLLLKFLDRLLELLGNFFGGYDYPEFLAPKLSVVQPEALTLGGLAEHLNGIEVSHENL